MSLSENCTKILASVILFLATLLVGTIPVYLFEYLTRRVKKKNATAAAAGSTTSINSKPSTVGTWLSHLNQETVIQFLTQIGGGVLLYTALIHMLPEIRDNYRTYQLDNNATTSEESCDTNPHNTLPLVDIITCVGFFGMFFVEEIMHTLLLKNHHHHYEKPGGSISSAEVEQNQTRKYYLISCFVTKFYLMQHRKVNVNELDHQHNHHHHHHHHNHHQHAQHDHNQHAKRKDTIVSISSGRSVGLANALGKISQGSQTSLEKLPISKSRRASYNACELTKIVCEDGQIDCKGMCRLAMITIT